MIVCTGHNRVCTLHPLLRLKGKGRRSLLRQLSDATFKSRSSATAPTYLTRHIKARVSERILRSSTASLLDKPFTRTDFANRAFLCCAPTVWNSLLETIMRCNSLSRFKSKLKTYFFHKAFLFWFTLTTDLPPAPLKLQPYGATQICLLLLLLLLLLLFSVHVCDRA